MLTNEFCVRGKFWEKDPHTHSPPPLSVVGVSNQSINKSSKHFHKISLYKTNNNSKTLCNLSSLNMGGLMRCLIG
jgi:hypothetical protein